MTNPSKAPRILVVDNYDSFTYNLVHYLQELGADTHVVRNDAMSAEEALALDVAGTVLSPGPCTPNEAGICVDYIESAPVDLPIFGVCLGHQSITQAFGGTIISAQSILHGKTSTITHNGHAMFEGVPGKFTAVRYHSLSAQASDFPSDLIATAHTDDGEIMALAHVDRPIFGVQFHPESIGSEYGHKILENFLNQTKEKA